MPTPPLFPGQPSVPPPTFNPGPWLVLAAAVLWGTTGTSQALAPAGAGPASIGALRLAVGGLGLLALAAAQGGLRGAGRWPLWPTLIGAVSMAAYQLLFFGGVARTGVAVGTIVGIGSSPVLAGVFGYLARGERPGWRWAAATALAVTGCALLVAAGSDIEIDLFGLLLAVGAGASYAAFTVASKTLLESKPPAAVMAVIFCLGALMLLPLFIGMDLRWLAQPRGLLAVLHLGLVTVALAYTLFARGLRRVPVATAATLTLGEPLTAGLLGVFLLHEPLTPLAGLGIALIFAGLAALSAGKAPPGFNRKH
ncbi:MAG: DMT family transporter [Chloroflexi bacterium]|nr:DMT family transporter [Chloroflexota bacterium]